MRHIYAVAVAAMALFVSACGGASFKDTANGACATRANTIRAEIEASGGASQAALLQKMIDASATELASLRALEPPPEQQARYRNLLTALDEQLHLTQQILAGAARGDSSAVQEAISRTGKAAAKATYEARMLGLSNCDWVT